MVHIYSFFFFCVLRKGEAAWLILNTLFDNNIAVKIFYSKIEAESERFKQQVYVLTCERE